MEIDRRLTQVITEHPYSLLFATISGAHLYGFPSPDSDFDLRGVHVLPVNDVIGLDTGRETVELSEMRDGLEIDLVTHDIKKFFLLLLKNNGYVLEQLYSPLIIHTTPWHEELKEIARRCITRHHAHHYIGFAESQWRLFEKEQPRRIKPLLYTFRVLLTGIHLMRTGEIEANLLRLNADAKLPYIDDLVARKMAGPEKSALDDKDVSLYVSSFDQLRFDLDDAYNTSKLPEQASCRGALDDLLVRVRLGRTDATPATTCPVCGLKNAFDEPGGYDICERCGWEDDSVQFANPDFPGGANKESLNEARAHREQMISRCRRKHNGSGEDN